MSFHEMLDDACYAEYGTSFEQCLGSSDLIIKSLLDIILDTAEEFGGNKYSDGQRKGDPYFDLDEC